MFERQFEIPPAEELRAEQPLPEPLKLVKAERDRLVKEVIAGETDKLLLIVGPCSAHDQRAVLEYVRRLGKLSERVEDKLVLVSRIYTSKPRTRGVGYMGMICQPDPGQEADILRGIRAVRDLHIRAIGESGLSAADEMLFPENYAYVEDLLSYHAVGARSSEDQQHRAVASGLDLPVGIKNPMSGSIPALLNSIYAAQHPQVFRFCGGQVRTSGNPFAHAVLRGGVDNFGRDVPNYHYETVMQLQEEYAREPSFKNPAVIVDASHSNSGKRFHQQLRVIDEVLRCRSFDREYRKLFKGFMVESFLKEGSGGEFGQSITDPCLGWEDTEKLILKIAENA